MTPLSEFLDPELIYRLNQLELPARSVAEGSAGGPRRAMRHGASIEFGQHRPFVTGDEPRRIDWRVLARSGKLFVREDQQETAARVMLCLDGSGSMRYGKQFGSKLRYAQRTLAALSYLLVARREAVGLATYWQAIDHWLSPSVSNDQLARILDTLARPASASDGSTQSSLGAIAERLIRRSLIVIASDFFLPLPEIKTALSRLRHRHHEVVLLRVLDGDELNFPFTSTIQFAGLERERSVLRNASLQRQQYLQRFTAHAQGLRNICDQQQIGLHELPTNVPLQESLIRLLSDRARWR